MVVPQLLCLKDGVTEPAALSFQKYVSTHRANGHKNCFRKNKVPYLQTQDVFIDLFMLLCVPKTDLRLLTKIHTIQ
jgi:hypothetical protein